MYWSVMQCHNQHTKQAKVHIVHFGVLSSSSLVCIVDEVPLLVVCVT